MKAFLLYTSARLLLFAVVFALIWLVFGHWLEWDAVSALYTAVIALVLSSLVALFALRSLRDRLAADVSRRADKMRSAYDAMRAAEDVDATGPGRSDGDGDRAPGQ